MKERPYITPGSKSLYAMRDIPALLKYTALSVICDGANTRLGTIFTPYEFYYAWNKANEQDTVANGISSLFTMVEGAFAKDRFLSILRDFIFGYVTTNS